MAFLPSIQPLIWAVFCPHKKNWNIFSELEKIWKRPYVYDYLSCKKKSKTSSSTSTFHLKMWEFFFSLFLLVKECIALRRNSASCQYLNVLKSNFIFIFGKLHFCNLKIDQSDVHITRFDYSPLPLKIADFFQLFCNGPSKLIERQQPVNWTKINLQLIKIISISHHKNDQNRGIWQLGGVSRRLWSSLQ